MESAFGVDHGGEVSKSLRGFAGALKDVAGFTAHKVGQSSPAHHVKMAGLKTQNKYLGARNNQLGRKVTRMKKKNESFRAKNGL